MALSIKNMIQIAIYLVILTSLIYGIYKDPNSILNTETQNKLIETGSGLDLKLQETFSGYNLTK